MIRDHLELSQPELQLLSTLLGPKAALRIAGAPGGWRTLSRHELNHLGLNSQSRDRVRALQQLVRAGYPRLEPLQLADASTVADVYSARFGGLQTEVVLAIAVDGQNRLLTEIEIASGGQHGAAVIPADVLRPLIRAGASGFILVHNHPSGDSSPSAEDVHLTRTVSCAAEIVGVALLDHVVIGARGGGWTSLLELGALEPAKEITREQQVAE